jgi:hypothetical protein
MVSGLGGTVTLRNNGTDELSIGSNGSFSFKLPITKGKTFDVEIASQPLGQTCVVAGGAGEIRDANITTISIVCKANSFSLSGSVAGLTQKGLRLKNGNDTISLAESDVSFGFPTDVAYGESYSISVQAQPAGQKCTVNNGIGTMGAEGVSNISVACSLVAACSLAPGRPKFGANVISVGNAYQTEEYSDANLEAVLAVLSSLGFRHISIRVIWQIMEPQAQGTYNDEAIAELNRILSLTDSKGFSVMLDFHTLFNPTDQWWQTPVWLSTIAPAISINGENIDAGSNRQLFYVDAVSDAYLAMMQNVMQQIGVHSSLKFVSMLNEPYLNWNSSSNDSYFSATVQKLVAGLRSKTAIPIGIRFLPGWNPWSDDSNKRIGGSVWQSLDYVAMNLYFPEDETFVVDGTALWSMARRSLDAVHVAGKPMIVSETGWMDFSDFGSVQGTDAQYASHWQAILMKFETYQPDVVQMWDAQNDGDYFSSSEGGFNVLQAQAMPADYVSNTIGAYLCH